MRESAAAYNEVYVAALGRTLDAYDAGDVAFVSEHDVQAEIMGHCRTIMVECGFERPFRMSSDLAVSPSAGGGKVIKHDLVLGLRDEADRGVVAHAGGRPCWCLVSGAAVAVEIKFERLISPSVQRKGRGLTAVHNSYAGSQNELATDLERLAICPPTIRHRHFLAIDEKGFWLKSRVTAPAVLGLTGIAADWVRRTTRAGHDYWVLAVELPVRG